MAINPTYPGIYIQEVPSSSHSITAAPTSIAVFVGYTHPFKTQAVNTPVQVFSFSDYEAQFGGFFVGNQSDGGLLVDGSVPRAVNDFFLNGGAQAYVVSTNGAAPPGGGFTYSTSDGRSQVVPAAGAAVAAATATVAGGIEFVALEPTGQSNFTMSVTISNVQQTTIPHDTADISITYGNRSETYRKVVLAAPPPGGKAPIEARVNPNSTLVHVQPNLNYPAAYPVGTTTVVLQTAQQPAADTGVFNPADYMAVFAADSPLDKLPVFNLLVLPGIVYAPVLSEALAFCERKRAFFLMDPPPQDIADAVPNANWVGDFMNNPAGDGLGNIAPKSQNGALYFPYLKSVDPATNQPINNPPSGYVAGIYSRTDQNRGVWKAPAGLETIVNDTTGVVDTGKMTDDRQGTLNPIAVNCLRSFPTGTVVFGARTLVGQTDNTAFEQWRYVPVRRMALFIEQTLLENLRWVIFEPNDTPLWNAIRSSIESFMLTLFSQGAFQGTKASDAFQVKCDDTTTTPTDIDQGRVNIVVAFAPLKPAEFVIIRLSQLAGQTQ